MAVVSTDRRFGVNSGAAFKVPVLAATTANITLSGTQTIDGVACITGDRVLVQNQTSSIDNGIYDVDTGAWTRSADFDGSYDVVYGTLIPINQGTVYAQRIRRVTTTGTITPGTTGLSFDDALYANATGIQFTQSGNGAVATTAAGEFGTWVKPQQFGAVGDGVHDDTAALALWIAAGATRALYLPSGTWTTTAEIA